MVSEISAFDMDEEMKEGEELIATVKAEELSKERQAVLALRKELS